ncbi:hypothetical protein V8F33_004851 [Rhypophila sp. PSN 637]
MTYTPTFADLLERDKTITHLQDQIDLVRNNLTDLRAQVRQKQAQNKLNHTPTSRFTARHGHTPDKKPEPTNTLSYKVSDLDEKITNLKLEVEALSRLASEKHWGVGVKSVRKRCPSCGTSFEDEVKKQEDTDSDEGCYDWIIEGPVRYTGFGTEEEKSRRSRERTERLDEKKALLEKEAEEERQLQEQKKEEKQLKDEEQKKKERRKRYNVVYTPPTARDDKARLSFQLG